MTKAPIATENSKKQSENTKTPPQASIAQWLRTDLKRSVWVTTATQLAWLNRFTGSQPSHYPQKLYNQKDTHLKFVNNHPKNDRWPRANQNGGNKNEYINIKSDDNSISKIQQN